MSLEESNSIEVKKRKVGIVRRPAWLGAAGSRGVVAMGRVIGRARR